MKMRIWLPVALCACAAAYFCQGYWSQPKVPAQAPLADFNLARLDSRGTVDKSSLLGKPWILNVFTSANKACTDENEVWSQARDDGFEYTLIGLDYQDVESRARKWLLQNGGPYDAVLNDADGRLAKTLGVKGTPETYVIDSKGIVFKRFPGPVTEELLKKELGPLMKKLEGGS